MQGRQLSIEQRASVCADILCGESLSETARRHSISRETVRRLRVAMSDPDFTLYGTVTEQVRTELTEVNPSSNKAPQAAAELVTDGPASLSALVVQALQENLQTQAALLAGIRAEAASSMRRLPELADAYGQLCDRADRILTNCQNLL
jgi:hypothetical protein